MTNLRKKLLSAISLVAAMLLLGSAAPAAAEIIIIANNNVSVSSLDASSLRDIYLGKKIFWDKKNKIMTSMLKSGKTHDDFLSRYIGKTAEQFANYWNRLVFTGSATPPVSFKTEQEIVDYVRKTDGAIGYVDSGTSNSGVKVIRVN